VAAGGGTPEGIPVEPEIEHDYGPFAFNLNGIVALKGGRSFIVVNWGTGKLFRIDLDERAPLGRRIHGIAVEPFLGGDGLLIDRGELLVVHGPPQTVSFVRLDARARRGRVVERRTDPSLRESSTIARARDFYLLVNPDFSGNRTPFTVTGLPRGCDGDEP
jgi:hypothetical protein